MLQSVLPAWHNQLLVYWAGKDVIICLAKDSKANSTSTLFVSQDYGGKFINVTSQLIMPGKTPPALEKFFNHPKTTGLVSKAAGLSRNLSEFLDLLRCDCVILNSSLSLRTLGTSIFIQLITLESILMEPRSALSLMKFCLIPCRKII